MKKAILFGVLTLITVSFAGCSFDIDGTMAVEVDRGHGVNVDIDGNYKKKTFSRTHLGDIDSTYRTMDFKLIECESGDYVYEATDADNGNHAEVRKNYRGKVSGEHVVLNVK